MDRYPLSPVDHLFLGPGSQPITFAFRFRNVPDPEQLRTTLDRALELFPLLRCRIGRTAEGTFEFQEAAEPCVLEIRDSRREFDPAEGTSPYIEPVRSVIHAPLARFVLTRTLSGPVLAVSLSHALVDGFSYFHFLSSWARICRGERHIPPSLDRSFFREIDAEAGGTGRQIDLTSACGLFTGDRRSDRSMHGPPERHSFSALELGSISEEARRSTGVPLTENDILVALLWKRQISLGGGAGSTVTCPVDFRRLLPGFPRTYLGCAIVFATASLSVDPAAPDGTGRSAGTAARPPADLSIGHLAVLVKDAVARMKGERILASIRALEAYRRAHGAAAMERVHLHHPDRGIIVTNLTRMPVNDVDFGPGPPQEFVPFVGVSGGSAILPGKDGISIITA